MIFLHYYKICNMIINHRIKGCYSKDINELVQLKMIDGCDITNNITHVINNILTSYTIKDCINIITTWGDIHDAYIKYYNRTGGNIDTTNKLKFHRELALYYVNEYIILKIEEKCKAFEKKDCIICLEEINNSMIKTSCKHVFHVKCLEEWKKRCITCPVCRAPNI